MRKRSQNKTPNYNPPSCNSLSSNIQVLTSLGRFNPCLIFYGKCWLKLNGLSCNNYERIQYLRLRVPEFPATVHFLFLSFSIILLLVVLLLTLYNEINAFDLERLTIWSRSSPILHFWKYTTRFSHSFFSLHYISSFSRQSTSWEY